jgi:hypothetical protein
MSLSFVFLELFVQEHKFGMCFDFLDIIFKSTLDGILFFLGIFSKKLIE